MRETSKSIPRRLSDSRFLSRYFVGRGIDVGAGNDPLSEYAALFPLMADCLPYDKEQGNAQLLSHMEQRFDFLYSSHCLEHLADPWEALRNWCETVRPGGYLVVIVPDEDLYEQGHWPSIHNDDHKHTFTMYKPRSSDYFPVAKSWSPVSINVLDLVSSVSNFADCVSVQRLDATHLPSRDDDQTLGIGECAIEFVLRRR